MSNPEEKQKQMTSNEAVEKLLKNLNEYLIRKKAPESISKQFSEVHKLPTGNKIFFIKQFLCPFKGNAKQAIETLFSMNNIDYKSYKQSRIERIEKYFNALIECVE
jgi:hypothetical protein